MFGQLGEGQAGGHVVDHVLEDGHPGLLQTLCEQLAVEDRLRGCRRGEMGEKKEVKRERKRREERQEVVSYIAGAAI